jgi:uncharacterized protein YndB with AHSA1/START domain
MFSRISSFYLWLLEYLKQKLYHMKIFKIVLIVIAIVIALPLILALFITKDYAVEREITINKPKQEVFEYIRHLKNQDNYNKWVMLDPNMKKEFRGTDGTEGFVYAWDGNDKAGKGEQEIKKITEGERIDVELRFKKPFEGIAYAPFTTEAVSESQTKVTWGMNGKSTYPMNFMNLFMDKMLGSDLETSLVALKSVVESK